MAVNWSRTMLGAAGGSESSRNVLEFDNATAYSGSSYFYSTPTNMITTKASGNLFIMQEIRPGSSTQRRVTIYDPYLNVLANGQPSIMFQKSSTARWSYGQPNLSDSSIGASGYGQDDVVVGYGGTYNTDSASVKATGLPSGYNHNEIKLLSQYYNTATAWTQAIGYKTHRIGNKAYDMRNKDSGNGWAFMSYKYPTGNETTWYTQSNISGQNPGRYISSGGVNLFEPLSPTSMTTDFLVAYSIPYGVCEFKTMDYLGAPKSTGRSGYVTSLNSLSQYWSPGQVDRANNEAYMFDSDQMILIKWNYSNGTITLYQVNLPGGVNRTQHSYPMVLLNGYIYLMAYSQNNSTGAMYIIRMLASNPTSNYVYKIYNTQGTSRGLSGFNMVEGPNNALGETDLLSIAFEYKSSSSTTDMIIGNMLFGDLPELSASGKVGAKLIVQGSTTTINNVTSSYTTYSQASSNSISTMYSGNQAVGYPGMSRSTNPWQSHTQSYPNGITKTSL